MGRAAAIPFPDGLTRFILDAPLDGAELPPTDVPLAAWDEVVAQVALAYDLLPPRGAGLSGSVGWSGTRENAATFELVLDFAEGGLAAP